MPATSNTSTRSISAYDEQRQAFRLHAAVFASSMVVISLVNLIFNLAAGSTGDVGAWWSGWALIGWGIGVAVHGFVVWLARSTGASPARSTHTTEGS